MRAIEMSSSLLRQRRNLISISLMLLLFDFADVSIAKVGILGTDLVVGNPQVLMMFAWAVWAYFLIRYYQYWNALESQPVSQSFLQLRESFAPLRNNFAASITRLSSFSCRLDYQEYDPESGLLSLHNEPASRLAIAWWSLKAAVLVGARSVHATDFLLPFALAFAAEIATPASKGFYNFLG